MAFSRSSYLLFTPNRPCTLDSSSIKSSKKSGLCNYTNSGHHLSQWITLRILERIFTKLTACYSPMCGIVREAKQLVRIHSTGSVPLKTVSKNNLTWESCRFLKIVKADLRADIAISATHTFARSDFCGNSFWIVFGDKITRYLEVHQKQHHNTTTRTTQLCCWLM